MEADPTNDQLDGGAVEVRSLTTLLKAAACYCDVGRRGELVQDHDGGVTMVPQGWPLAADEWTAPETMADRLGFARALIDRAEELLQPEEVPAPEEPPVEEAVELTPEEELRSKSREELREMGGTGRNKDELVASLMEERDDTPPILS